MPFGLFNKKPMPGQEPPDGWQPAGDGLAAGPLTRGGATEEAITAAEASLSAQLPPSLVAFLRHADAAEGWVGGGYLSMWPVAAISDLNDIARVPEFAPNFVAFATDGGGEGYFFDRTTGEFINSPMIGLGYIEATAIGSTVEALLEWIAAKNPALVERPVADPSRFGQVIHEIKPILFGGSPTDPENKVLLPLAKYAEIVGWWNGQVRNARQPALGQQET